MNMRDHGDKKLLGRTQDQKIREFEAMAEGERIKERMGLKFDLWLMLALLFFLGFVICLYWVIGRESEAGPKVFLYRSPRGMSPEDVLWLFVWLAGGVFSLYKRIKSLKTKK